MPKRYSTKELVQFAQYKGFFRITQKGSHIKYKNKQGKIAIIPQKNKPIPIGTTNSIVEQLGGDMKELEKFIL